MNSIQLINAHGATELHVRAFGQTKIAKGELDEAEDALAEAESAAGDRSQGLAVASVLRTRGRLAAARGDGAFVEYYREAIQGFKTVGRMNLVAQAHAELGRHFAATGDVDAAYQEMDAANRVALGHWAPEVSAVSAEEAAG